nr:hypothetical protein [Tanacetum cinerariifolium]
MVAILKNGEYNTDFYPMVDFIAASPLKYALTVKPTIFVSHIRQFWSTARIKTTEEGTHILATVDGIQRTVFESSLRCNFKLRDEDEIVSLPDTELFENLTLMGYNISQNQKFTFQKGQFSHQWKYLIHTIIPSFSWRIVPLFDTMLVHQGEGSGTPIEPHHTPSPEANPSYHTTSSMPLLSIPTAPISPVTQTETTPIQQYTRRARIAQSSALPPVTDEPASLVRDVSEGEACPTDSSFIADQDRAQEMEIHKLKDRVKILEDKEGVTATQSGDDAPIKGKSINEGEAATERISDDLEELARVLTSMDAATVLTGGIDVPTGSGFIPTAGPPVGDIPTSSDVVPTASLVFATATVVTPYSRRKGKEVMVESDTPKKQRLQEQIDAQVARELEEQQEREDKRMTEQIARDAEVARIHAEEELQGMIDSLDRTNETIAKYIQEYQEFASELPLERRIELISDLVKYQDNYAKTYKFQSQQRKPWTKKQNKDFYMAVKEFIPMGSKEEAEIHKRKGIRFDQESSKKLKSSEEVIKDVKSTEEIPKEKMKEMIQLVPIEEVYVQALQVKHPIIDWKVYTEGQKSYWKIFRLGGSSACYQFFIDLLKQLDREDLNQLWALVKEYLSIRSATSEKEMELWVELKKLYEPDPEDQLWTRTQNFMHAPVEWKLYDLCGVHQVTAKDKDIFMLVEKDYPLRNGLAIVMISYKLQVETYSRMANELVLKIYKIASTPSRSIKFRGGLLGIKCTRHSHCQELQEQVAALAREYHIDQSPPQDLDLESHFLRSHRDNNRILEELHRTLKPNPLVGEPEGSDDFTEVPFDDEQIQRQYNTAHMTPPPLAYTPPLCFLATMKPLDTFLMRGEIISTTLVRENNKFIKSSVDDLVSILRESEVTSVSPDLECSMHIDSPPLPYTDVLGDAILDTDLSFVEHLDTLSTRDREINFSHIMDIEELEWLLANDLVPVPEVFDEPLGNSDSVPISYDVTFSNSLFDFNDDYTLCYDNLLFDKELEDISSL